jgi:GntR family transcriptional regulator
MRDRRPLPIQIREQLLAEMQAAALRPGDMLAPEVVLADRLAVSRATVREALKLLESEGVITVRRGKGRYVSAAKALDGSLNNLESVTELTTRLGYRVDVRVVSVEVRSPTEEEANALKNPALGEVIDLRRAWVDAGEPVIYSIDVFPRSSIPGPIADVGWSGSLLGLLEAHGRRVASAVADIRAVNLDPDTARQLGVPLHLPWLLMTHRGLIENGDPVLFSQDYHRGDRFTFHARRRRASSAAEYEGTADRSRSMRREVGEIQDVLTPVVSSIPTRR